MKQIAHKDAIINKQPNNKHFDDVVEKVRDPIQVLGYGEAGGDYRGG